MYKLFLALKHFLTAAGLRPHSLLRAAVGGPSGQPGTTGKYGAGPNKRCAKKIFASRPAHIMVCPACGAAQSREQDFCCSCGTVFLFLDETNRFCG